MVVMHGYAWLASRLQRLLRSARARSAGVTSMVFIGWGVGAPVIGLLSDRIRRRKLPFVLGMTLTALGMAGLAWVPGLPLWAVSALCFLCGFGGSSQIVGFAAVDDVGRAVNPLILHGQTVGGAVMGMGQALSEETQYHEGLPLRPNFIDYRIPTSMDLPIELISEQIENGDGPGPYGAKGVSEGAILCVAPALGAAVLR